MYYDYVHIIKNVPMTEGMSCIISKQYDNTRVYGCKYKLKTKKLFNAVWPYFKMVSVAKWCDKNLQDKWIVGRFKSGFKNEDDYKKFKKQWIRHEN